MRSRRVALLALLAFLAAACSSSPPLAAAEYFPAVEAELARLDQATKDLTDRFADEIEAELATLVEQADVSVPGEADRVLQQIIDVARDKMGAIIDAHTDQVDVFASRVDELAPPNAVASSHVELVGAFRSWAQSGNATLAQLAEATDLNELALVLTGSPYADARIRVDGACRALVDNAAAVGVTLTCPGDELSVLDVGP